MRVRALFRGATRGPPTPPSVYSTAASTKWSTCLDRIARVGDARLRYPVRTSWCIGFNGDAYATLNGYRGIIEPWVCIRRATVAGSTVDRDRDRSTCQYGLSLSLSLFLSVRNTKCAERGKRCLISATSSSPARRFFPVASFLRFAISASMIPDAENGSFPGCVSR